MTGDFTRNTFDPTKNYRQVLMQQGRVMLDADFNENTSILLHYIRTLTADIFGAHAGPAGNPGFEIIGNSPGLDARLTPLVPDAKRRSFLKDKIANGDALISAGRYYVNGILVENHNPILYTEQPGYPFSENTTPEALKAWNRGMLVYLDVWQRHITFEQDDHIREVALGGPDTCSRSQVVWQVKVLLEPTDGVPGVAGAVFNCSAVDKLPQTGTGKLRAHARLDKPPTELCSIPPESRYRGAENQLYRVQIHKGGSASDPNGATFKWSRENGSVVFPILSLSGTTAKLGHLGRDRRSTLNPGDWVEFDDEIISLGQKPGVLAQVDTVTRDSMTVTLRPPDGVASLPAYADADIGTKRPLLRRWDHRGDPKAFGGALQIVEQDDNDQGRVKGYIDLEDGVQVWFARGGQYRAGDYWQIPARTATGDVEWPHDHDSSGKPMLDSDGNPIGAAIGPRGTHHYYAPLLLGSSDPRTYTDCRCRIERLPCAGYRYAFNNLGIGGDNL
jgi:Family of unknown function (DUF6519)